MVSDLLIVTARIACLGFFPVDWWNFLKLVVVYAAFAVEGQVKEKSRWCQLLKDLSEKFKVIQSAVFLYFYNTIL
jgi:hypothetical protein